MLCRSADPCGVEDDARQLPRRAQPRLFAITCAACRSQDWQCDGNTGVEVGLVKLLTGFAENVVACSARNTSRPLRSTDGVDTALSSPHPTRRILPWNVRNGVRQSSGIVSVMDRTLG